MATTTIPWDDGSGDNLYFTAPAMEGDQTVVVTSDANAGQERTKTVRFSADGVEPKSLGVIQLGSGSSGGGPIPSGYVPLRYVETDSQAYIDTGIGSNNDNLVIEGVIAITKYYQYGYVYGNYVAEATNCTRLIISSTSGMLVNNNSRANSSASRSYVVGEKMIFKSAFGASVWGGISSATAATTKGTANNNNIYIGKGNGAANVRDLGLRISWFKITNNGTPAIELLPCKRISDNVAGFYDLVSETFKTSDSATAFTAGPEW